MTTSHSTQISLPYTRFRIRDKNVFLRRKLLELDNFHIFVPFAGFVVDLLKIPTMIIRKC